MNLRLFTFGCFALLLMGCASSPFQLEGVKRDITPAQTISDKQWLNETVLWGGVIVGTQNFKESSQIEVLSYPLDSIGEPIRSSKPLGRFILKYDSFLEPAQYSSGRWLSALGKVQPSQAGKVGDAEYQYPVMQARQLHIWAESSSSDVQTRFHFGIGIHR